MIEGFRCAPYRADLSVSACVSRARTAKAIHGQQARITKGRRLDDAGHCRRCDVGHAHAAGSRPDRWPDGTPIVRLDLAARAKPSVPVVAPAPQLREVPGLLVPQHQVERVRAAKEKAKKAKAKRAASERREAAQKSPWWPTYTHDGLTLSLSDWAGRTSIPHTTLADRLRRGWPIDRALTTPARPKAKPGEVRLDCQLQFAVHTPLHERAREHATRLRVTVNELLRLAIEAIPALPAHIESRKVARPFTDVTLYVTSAQREVVRSAATARSTAGSVVIEEAIRAFLANAPGVSGDSVVALATLRSLPLSEAS